MVKTKVSFPRGSLLPAGSRSHDRCRVYSCTRVSRKPRQVYVRLLHVCLHLSAVRFAVRLLQIKLYCATILSPPHLDYSPGLAQLPHAHADRGEYGIYIRQHGSCLGCTCSSASLCIGRSIWIADILMHHAWGHCPGFRRWSMDLLRGHPRPVSGLPVTVTLPGNC